MPVRELSPIWHGAPRYCSHRSFPSYRFMPGVNPHPRRDPKGHAFGKLEERPLPIPPERWSENEPYLFGIDLYHQGYLWESHEAWEALWHLTGKEDVEGQFLQGLIQNSAALLKVYQGQWEGARHLSREAHRRLEFVVHSGTVIFMGIDVCLLVKDLETFYAPLWADQEAVHGAPPRVIPNN